jgi:hypothetical protein
MINALRAMLRIQNLLTWAGLAVISGGFILIAVAWGRTAGLTDVGLQMPYVMSAGFTGLGLICSGITLVAIDARLRDAAARRAQSLALRDALAELGQVRR